MDRIDNYLLAIKKEIISKKGDVQLMDEFESSIAEEWKDYQREYPDTPAAELEKSFVSTLEPPAEIAKSLIGETKLADKKSSIILYKAQQLLVFYRDRIMTDHRGYLLTFFAIWLIPGLILLLYRLGFYRFFQHDLTWLIYWIVDSSWGFSMFRTSSFTIYTVFVPDTFFEALYTYSVVHVFLFALFTGYVHKSSPSLLQSFTVIISSAFAFSGMLFSTEAIAYLTGTREVLPQHDPIVPRLFLGYSSLFGSLLYLSLLVIIVLVIYDTVRKNPLREDYAFLVNLINDKKSSLFAAIIVVTVSFSPIMLSLLESPSSFTVLELTLVLLLLVVLPIALLAKYGFRFGTKVVLFQVPVLIMVWLSFPINTGFIALITGTAVYFLKRGR